MDAYGACVFLAFSLVFAISSAHIASHDNILRIQLWDAEGLSKNPDPTSSPTAVVHKHTHKSKVDLDTLYHAMLDDVYGNTDTTSRFTRHKVRHKRRRSRESGDEIPWKFHSGVKSYNVAVYDENVPWDIIEGRARPDGGIGSDVQSDQSANVAVNEDRQVGPPMPQRQDEEMMKEEEDVKKPLPVVTKCCSSGHNLSAIAVDGSRVCERTSLTFQPTFYAANDSFMWNYYSNLFEIIVDNPCNYSRYKLDPNVNNEDEFYLLINGSLFAPQHDPPLLGLKDFCMETFYDETFPAGLTLPLICFQSPAEEVNTSMMLTLYALGLIISVPFLLATAAVYTFIRELRDTYGKSLAMHTICLAVAFSCLAATQLAGHKFPDAACKVMAHTIQYSFISCFFWLNVMCFDTLNNVRRHLEARQRRRDMRKKFAWYCAYAVILPLLLLIVTIFMELSPAVPSSYLKPNFGIKGCWFQTDKAALPYFYIPVALSLIANIIMFFITARVFSLHNIHYKLNDVNAYELTHSSFSNSQDWKDLEKAIGEQIPSDRSTSPLIDKKTRLKKYKKIFRTCCLLSIIMGISWVFEVVSWAAGAGSSVFSVWSVFDFLNAMQGVVIFAIFVMQQPVRSRIKFSKLCQVCRRRSNVSEVVSDRTSIEMGVGKSDAV